MAQDLKVKKNQASELSKKRKAAVVSITTSDPEEKRARLDLDKELEPPTPRDIPASEDTNSEVSADDQAAALLKGFESSSDSEESGEHDEKFKRGQDVPTIAKTTELKNKLKAIKDSGHGEGESGVVYVGRIPHGFYEHEMRAYFSQFGTIERLRLSRNRRTGHSKHYAFLEFTSAQVAKIVANTMDNYLMFGHILKCKVVPKEQIHADLWKGANKRFKHVPRAKIEGRKLEMGKGRDSWERKIDDERRRREAKIEKLKAIGYDFNGGDLKGVDQVPIREKNLVESPQENGNGGVEQKLITNSEGEERATIVGEVLEAKEARGGEAERERLDNVTSQEQHRPISEGDGKVSKTKTKKRKSGKSGAEDADASVDLKKELKKARRTKTEIKA